jgi:crossover junction endodeoxyribonuclease RuvC
VKIVGVDPGINGGIAFFENTLLVSVVCTPIIKNEKKKNTLDNYRIGKMIQNFAPDYVYIEKVGAMPGQGVTSMFNFGFVTGCIYGICGGLGIPIREVRPQEWKKTILKENDHDKDAAVAFCLENFADIDLKRTKRCKKDHDGMAEAVCIALYGLQNNINNKNGA